MATETTMTAPDDNEDTVECLQCTERVAPELARCTNSGWVCDTCMENMS